MKTDLNDGSEQRPLAFKDLLEPLSSDTFFTQYWGKEFLHHSPTDGIFEHLFSARDIERWARSTRNGFFFVLHPVDETVRIESFQARDVIPGSVSANYEKGLAQVMKRVSDWPTLQDFVSHLEGLFHATVNVNIFLTPGGARSHPTYTCNDDILILQLEGEEAWQLRELTVNQLNLEEKKHLEFSDEWMGRHQNPVVSEVRLRPGEMLYIPRGMPHFAASPESGLGLHLRVYISTLTWVDFLKTAVEYAAIHSEDMRRSLPPGFLHSNELCASMAGDFESLKENLQSAPFEKVLAAVRRSRVSHQGFPPADFIGVREEPEVLTHGSELERRRSEVLCTVEETFDGARRPKCALFFGDQHQVNGPLGLRRAFEFIRDNKSFRVSDIPGLDEKSQLVLARRLIAEGFLRSRS